MGTDRTLDPWAIYENSRSGYHHANVIIFVSPFYLPYIAKEIDLFWLAFANKLEDGRPPAPAKEIALFEDGRKAKHRPSLLVLLPHLLG